MRGGGDEVLALAGGAAGLRAQFADAPGVAAGEVEGRGFGGWWGLGAGSHSDDARRAPAPGRVLVRQRVKRWSSSARDCAMWFQNRRSAAARARSAAARGLKEARIARTVVVKLCIDVSYIYNLTLCQWLFFGEAWRPSAPALRSGSAWRGGSRLIFRGVRAGAWRCRNGGRLRRALPGQEPPKLFQDHRGESGAGRWLPDDLHYQAAASGIRREWKNANCSVRRPNPRAGQEGGRRESQKRAACHLSQSRKKSEVHHINTISGGGKHRE